MNLRDDDVTHFIELGVNVDQDNAGKVGGAVLFLRSEIMMMTCKRDAKEFLLRKDIFSTW